MSITPQDILNQCKTVLAECIISANRASSAAAEISDEGLATLNSPIFTGNPTAPTPPVGDASASIATTAFLGRLFGQPNGLPTLDNTGVIPVAQLPFAGLTSDGTWNAATNTPHLTSSNGTAGHFFVVTVSGSTNLNGNSTWNVGDWALFSGGVWGRVPFTAPPVSNLPLSALAGIANNTFVGNTAGGSASPTAISISSIINFLAIATGVSGSLGGSIGLVPAPPALTGTNAFLAADMTYKVPAGQDLSAYATLFSPAFTGTATAATQARGNFGSAIASTAFVTNQLAQTADGIGLLQVNGTAAMGTSTYAARIDHIHGTDTSRASAVNPQLTGSGGVYNGTLSLNGNFSLNGLGPTIGYRNRLINGAMFVDQRFQGVASTVTAATLAYIADRWWVKAGGTTVGQRINTGVLDFVNALRVQRAAGNSSTAQISAGQTVETINCQDMAGRQFTLSFYAASGVNFSASGGILKVEVVSGNGTDQGTASLDAGTWSGQASVINASQVITTTRTRYTFTGTLGGSVREVAVRLSYVPVGVAGANDYFDITGVQLELGGAPTVFEFENYGSQLNKCKRYFECDTSGVSIPGGQFASNAGLFSRSFEAEKRVVPTVAAAGVTADYQEFINNTTIPAASGVPFSAGTTTKQVLLECFFNATAGFVGWLSLTGTNARINYDAEL